MNHLKVTTGFVLMIMFLFVITDTFAQIERLSKNAGMIVKGEVLSQESHWNKNKTRIYTDNKIIINSVFKGSPSDSIITVTTVGGKVEDYFQFQLHSVQVQKNSTAYFFLKESNENRIRFLPKGYHKLRNLPFENIILDGNKYSVNEFEREIINQTRKPKMQYSEYTNLNKRDTVCNVISLRDDDLEIEFTFDSVEYTDNYQYLEFDIMAEVNTPGLKFGGANLFVNYTDEFGSSVVSNQSVEVTKGNILQSSSLYNISYQDTSNQSIFISANSSFGSNNLYTFGASPESMFHVKIRIEDFQNIGKISFDSLDITGQVFYWCHGNYNLFDQVNLDDPVTAVNPEEGSEIGITYTIENLEPINNNSQLQFDIYAKADAPTSYSVGYVYVEYNSSGFPLNQVSNGTLQFTRGEIISDQNTYEVEVSDYNGNGFMIHSSPFLNANPNNLFNLGTDPNKYATIILNVNDCDENANLVFDEEQMNDDKSTHFTGDDPIPFDFYEPIVADDKETGKICECSDPKITSFSPDKINAGNDEVLSIRGENFGNYTLNESFVSFRNGSDGGITWIKTNEEDLKWNNVTHWSNSEIKIEVPSSSRLSIFKNPPATGKVKVENECGSDISENKLHIPYALINLREGSGITKKITLKELTEGGICFTYDTDLPSWIRTEFENALSDWCSKTDISFFIEENDVDKNEPDADDDLNHIVVDEVSSGIGGAAMLFTLQRTDECTNGNEQGYFMTDIDIIVDPSQVDIGMPDQYDKIDMRNKLKHELGHAQMIHHAIIPGITQPYNQSIVYYSFTATHSGGIPVSIKSDDSDGANALFSNSQDIIAGACGAPVTKTFQCGDKCSDATSIENVANSSSVSIYPNPSNGIINVDHLSFNTANSTVKITDGSGKIIYSKSIDNNKQTIKLEQDVSPGIYLLKYHDDERRFTKKIIVQ